MTITMKLFGPAAQRIGRSEIIIHISAKTVNCRTLRLAMGQQYPQLAELMPSGRLAVNCAYGADDLPISEHDEVAWIQAVSGG